MIDREWLRIALPVCQMHHDPSRWPERVHDEADELLAAQGAVLSREEVIHYIARSRAGTLGGAASPHGFGGRAN
jgi:hypothetical protein